MSYSQARGKGGEVRRTPRACGAKLVQCTVDVVLVYHNAEVLMAHQKEGGWDRHDRIQSPDAVEWHKRSSR